MAFTLAQLISQVRENLQDPAGSQWSDSVITQQLNDAQRAIAPMAFLVTSWSANVSAGTASVARPTDLLIPHKVYFQCGDDQWELIRRHGIPEDPVTITGDPDTAYFASGNIYIRPVPQQDGTIIISGNVRPPDLVNTTDTSVLEDAEPALVAYATWVCLASTGDPAALMWKEIYEQRRTEWAILDASKNPQRSRIDRSWF